MSFPKDTWLLAVRGLQPRLVDLGFWAQLCASLSHARCWIKRVAPDPPSLFYSLPPVWETLCDDSFPSRMWVPNNQYSHLSTNFPNFKGPSFNFLNILKIRENVYNSYMLDALGLQNVVWTLCSNWLFHKAMGFCSPSLPECCVRCQNPFSGIESFKAAWRLLSPNWLVTKCWQDDSHLMPCPGSQRGEVGARITSKAAHYCKHPVLKEAITWIWN